MRILQYLIVIFLAAGVFLVGYQFVYKPKLDQVSSKGESFSSACGDVFSKNVKHSLYDEQAPAEFKSLCSSLARIDGLFGENRPGYLCEVRLKKEGSDYAIEGEAQSFLFKEITGVEFKGLRDKMVSGGLVKHVLVVFNGVPEASKGKVEFYHSSTGLRRALVAQKKLRADTLLTSLILEWGLNPSVCNHIRTLDVGGGVELINLGYFNGRCGDPIVHDVKLGTDGLLEFTRTEKPDDNQPCGVD